MVEFWGGIRRGLEVWADVGLEKFNVQSSRVAIGCEVFILLERGIRSVECVPDK